MFFLLMCRLKGGAFSCQYNVDVSILADISDLSVDVSFALAYVSAGMSRPPSACLGFKKLGCVHTCVFGCAMSVKLVRIRKAYIRKQVHLVAIYFYCILHSGQTD